MAEYRVSWSVDVEATSAEEAARMAQRLQQTSRLGYWSGSFEVDDHAGGGTVEIDLDAIDNTASGDNTVEREMDRVRKIVLDVVKKSIADGVLDQGTLMRFLGAECGLGASPAHIEAAKAVHSFDDELEMDDYPLTSESEGGFWFNAWLWVPVDDPAGEIGARADEAAAAGAQSV